MMGALLAAAPTPRAVFSGIAHPRSWWLQSLWCVHRCAAARSQGRSARAVELVLAAPSSAVWQCVRARGHTHTHIDSFTDTFFVFIAENEVNERL